MQARELALPAALHTPIAIRSPAALHTSGPPHRVLAHTGGPPQRVLALPPAQQYSGALLSLSTLRPHALVTTAAYVRIIAEGPPIVQRAPDTADSDAQTQTSVIRGASPDVPLDYICPILHTPMEDPVVAADGRTYERSAIQEWINRGHATSPLTNLPMSSFSLRPNISLRNTFDEFKHMKDMLAAETRKREELEEALEDTRHERSEEARKREELEEVLEDTRQDCSDEVIARFVRHENRQSDVVFFCVRQSDMVVTKIEAGGLLDHWNSEHVHKAVKVGDKLVGANGMDVHSESDLDKALRLKMPKLAVSLRFRRGSACESDSESDSESLCAMLARRFGS